MDKYYAFCLLCPNYCKVDRRKSVGRCGMKDEVVVAWSGLHKGEEPPLTGEKGSGMIFFSGCPLHCAYCQNIQISSCTHENAVGVPVSVDELVEMMFALENMGAHTLNLVTGTHFIPSIASALETARKKGLKLKTVWNSSGYESVEGLEIIDKYIDLYLLDCKTLDSDVASRFAGTKRYADVITPVLDYIRKKHKKTDLGKIEGTILRHLLFPGELASTIKFLKFFAKNYKDNFVLSMMVQFVPPRENPGFEKVSEEEYDEILFAFDEFGIDDGFVQELGDEFPWIPDFTRDNPFPESFATPSPYFLSLKGKKRS